MSVNVDIYNGTSEHLVESIYSIEAVKTEVFFKCKTNTLQQTSKY